MAWTFFSPIDGDDENVDDWWTWGGKSTFLKKLQINFRVFVDVAAGIVMISHFRRLPIRIRCWKVTIWISRALSPGSLVIQKWNFYILNKLVIFPPSCIRCWVVGGQEKLGDAVFCTGERCHAKFKQPLSLKVSHCKWANFKWQMSETLQLSWWWKLFLPFTRQK